MKIKNLINILTSPVKIFKGNKLPKKVVNNLNSSPNNEISFKGGILKKKGEGGYILVYPSGYEKIYSSKSFDLIAEYFP